ncbi:hypothetical protein [Nitrosococcus wardiae]|uniref:Uncharacterized protein n=1 Tax=Nitrosococcus wardiae TaxID=1814290 RepID=A0A4P7C2W1_9GAMM|nr:hypothetical protein [Nitrosococcus wardiae]QBQ56089.1 hypothetical protein E3U44_17410 [Nitrosococcus wardiae]
MGLFDLPAPLFDAIDGLLPPAWRLWLWGLAGGAASMGLYWLLSPQQRITQNKCELAEARQALNRFEGEFAEAAPMIKRMLGLAFKQVGIVAIPALIAMLPVLFLLAWMSTSYAHHWPEPGEKVEGRTTPEGFRAEWLASNSAAHVLITDESGTRLANHPMTAPVPVLHKRQWWNVLLGNPVGYLPPDLPVESVEFVLPQKEYLGFGPDWMRGWEFSVLMSIFIGALGLKLGFRIQ